MNGENSAAASAVFERGINEIMNEENSMLQDAIKDGVVEPTSNVKKLTYSENIGLQYNCPTVEKKYRSNSKLMADYNSFKNHWEEIARHNPMEYSIDEIIEDGSRSIGLSTHVGDLLVVRVVTIEF